MNRREFLASSAALAGQHKLLRAMGTVSIGGSAAADAPKPAAPHNLLTTTYSESFLESRLIPVNEWHPYPRCSERGPWEAIPADIRAAFVEQAKTDQATGWPPILATTFLEFKRTGNQQTYEAANYGRRGRLTRLVLTECMEGQGRFLDDIANGIWAICEETFWGISAHMHMQKAGVGLPDVTEPIVDLFAAETVQLLAWTSYLLGEQLNKVSPLIVKRIQIESERRILQPARDRNDFSWMGLDGKNRRLNNWNPWINSNLLVANLLLEDNPQLRLKEMVRITRSIDQYLNQYWPDAAEEEGPAYFSRSPMCCFECISLLESATGNSTNIFANPFIDAMGRFILNAHIAGDDYINYSDADMKLQPDGDLLYRYGKAVHDDQLMAFGSWCAVNEGWTAKGPGLAATLRGSLATLSRPLPAVLAAQEIRSAPSADALLRDSWYPDFGLMTAREKANSTEGMYVAVLASNNGRSHGHNDTGNFIIFQDGEPVTIDVGVETYNSKTFSADRYKIWTMQSAYHNLPTIGGVMQHDGAEYKATERKYSSNNQQAMISFDIAAAYPKEAGVKRWIRTVTLDREHHRVIVEEDFELERAVPVSLSLMTTRSVAAGWERPRNDSSGRLSLQLPRSLQPSCHLTYDPAVLLPAVEKISLTDARLRRDWGNEIYRIRLNSKQPVAKGNWSYEFVHP